MMATRKIRIGVVGANASYGWSPQAHLPALVALPEYEVAAVCTAHPDTARESSEKFGVPLAFHDIGTMLAKADLDAVSIVVRVPGHYALTKAALEAGKHTLCEWPLGNGLEETRELAGLARSQGIHSATCLQGRYSPVIVRMKELIDEGYVGELVSCHMTQLMEGVLERPSDRTWQSDKTQGATHLTIQTGHAIDYFCMCVGEFSEVAAQVSTQVDQWHQTDTGHMVDVTAPDNILVSGRLANGAVASVHVASVPWHGGGYKIRVFGREGTLFIDQSEPGYGWMGGIRLLGGRSGDSSLQELPIPERLTSLPDGVPSGPAENVARLYRAWAEAISTGNRFIPDFDSALIRYNLLDAIQRASDQGAAPRVEGLPDG